MDAQAFINSVLLELGVLSQGESPNASESAAALVKLNQILGSWDAIRLNCFAINRSTYPLTSGTASYTIGSGATFNANRPMGIRSANILSASGGYRFPLEIVPPERWSQIVEPSQQANIPRVMYYDNAYPQARIWVHPIPNTTPTLELFTWEQLTQIASLATTIDLPPGYELALRYILAIELASSYGRPIVEPLATNGANALAAIRAVNLPPYPGAAQEVQAQGGAQPIPPDAANVIPRA